MDVDDGFPPGGPDFSDENLLVLREALLLGFLDAAATARFAKAASGRRDRPAGLALLAEGALDADRFRRVVARLESKLRFCPPCRAFHPTRGADAAPPCLS
ncbi:MAG: hypothetical protein MUC63_07750 [Planctomycetes bacterium]|jgi:hypothetical protein|nr:hypothetical protein [Planctomycetota bacterium]